MRGSEIGTLVADMEVADKMTSSHKPQSRAQTYISNDGFRILKMTN